MMAQPICPCSRTSSTQLYYLTNEVSIFEYSASCCATTEGAVFRLAVLLILNMIYCPTE